MTEEDCIRHEEERQFMIADQNKRILELEADLAESKKRTKELGDPLRRMHSDASQRISKAESAIKKVVEIHGISMEMGHEPSEATVGRWYAESFLKRIKQLCEKCIDGLGENK